MENLAKLTDDEMIEYITLAGCTLNRSPKKNWVENEGGLPEY